MFQSESSAPSDSTDYPFIRAAHYFGDQWPVNFWNSFDWHRVPNDMASIKADGFNTVILVIPWYPFSPAGDGEALTFYRAGLRHVMQAAQDAGLYIVLRVSYPHDTLGDVSRKSKRLCVEIMMGDCRVLSWWKDSLRSVQEIAARFHRYIYAFLSWEDVWCAIRELPTSSEAERRRAAEKSGFQAYALNRLGRELASYLCGRPVDSAGEIAIPERRSPFFIIYKEFVEEFLRQHLLPAGREAIPELGFEARLDKEPVDGLRGTTYWASYNLFMNDGLRASYWAPFMGQKNVGETVDAATAAASLKRVLDRLTNWGRQPDHLLEQFNFVDNTPKFPHAARISESEVWDFLEMAAPMLLEQSAGYGIWTYRDYRHNYLANAAFNMGLAAFDLQGNGELVSAKKKGNFLHVAGNVALSQKVLFQATLQEMNGVYGPLFFCLSACATDPTPFSAKIYLNDDLTGAIEGLANEAKRAFCRELAFDYSGPERSAWLRIELDAGGVDFSGFALFNHVQKGGVYDLAGAPGPHLAAIRRLNQRLSG